MSEQLVVGDVMRMSVELVDQIKTEQDGYTLLVRVARILRDSSDGSVVLYLENA